MEWVDFQDKKPSQIGYNSRAKHDLGGNYDGRQDYFTTAGLLQDSLWIKARQPERFLAGTAESSRICHRLGRKLENKVFAQAGTEYQGAIVERTRVVGASGLDHPEQSVNRGPAVADKPKAPALRIPLDEKLGIHKEHTPGREGFGVHAKDAGHGL
jgi:hypothetical protein